MTLPIETLLNAARANRDFVVQQSLAPDPAPAQPTKQTQSTQGGSDFSEAAGEFVKAALADGQDTKGPQTAQSQPAQQPFTFTPEQLKALQPAQQQSGAGNGSLLDLIMSFLQNGT